MTQNNLTNARLIKVNTCIHSFIDTYPMSKSIIQHGLRGWNIHQRCLFHFCIQSSLNQHDTTFIDMLKLLRDGARTGCHHMPRKATRQDAA